MKRAGVVTCVFLVWLTLGCPASYCDSGSAAGAMSSATATPNPQPSPGAAKGSPDKTAQTLPVMVVTATRIRQPLSEIGTSVSVVDSQQIQSQKIDQASEVLREVPGVQVTQSGSPGSVTDVSIRGATAAQTLIMIDGVEVNSGATGSFNLSDITTEGLSRVEVVRGAGGALYGSQAIGGVVNLLTERGSGPPKVTLSSEGGNRATQRQIVTLNGSQGALGYAGALSYYSTSGYRAVNDNSDNLSGALRLDYQPTADTAIRGFARYFRSNVSLANLTNFIPTIDPNAHQRDEFMLFKGEIDHRFGKRLRTNVSSYFVRDDLRINALPLPAYPFTETDRIPDEIRGTTWEADYSWTPHLRTLVGFDFKDRWARTLDEFGGFGATSVTTFHARRQEYAGYVEQEASLFDGLINATGGFRVDGNSDFGKEVSSSWAVSIPLAQYGITLRGSYSEGFRAPSFNELYYPFFGNPDLSPEISSEYDGGVTKTFGERFSITTTYFSRRVHNLIVAVPLPPPIFSQAGNAERVDVQGIEFVPTLELLPGLTLSGNFTWIDETHVAAARTIQPVRVPKKAAFGLLQYIRRGLYFPADQTTLSLDYLFVGDRDDIDPTTFSIRNNVAYHRFDLVASYQGGVRWHRVRNEELFARVQNLFDRNYSEVMGFKSPAVNFLAGIKLDF
jgi:vitamin B12 transporter